MLHPYASSTNLDADGLRAAVALRDESIGVSAPKSIRLMDVNRQTVMVDDHSTPQPIKAIAAYLGAPAGFLTIADRNLAQHIIDHQLSKVGDKRELVFRNGKAIGNRPAGSITLRGEAIVDKLIEGVGEVRRASFYDMGDHIDITLAGDKITLKPKVDDITEGGLRCLYSELLARAPTIEPYVERRVCTNGMTIRQELETFKFDTLDDFLAQFDDSILRAQEIVDTTIRAQLQKAAETPVERSEQAIRTIFTNARLNSRLLGPAIAALAVEDDGTAFGVLQALTRAANAMPYTQRLSLQSTAAREMARLETVHCPTCWSSLVH